MSLYIRIERPGATSKLLRISLPLSVLGEDQYGILTTVLPRSKLLEFQKDDSGWNVRVLTGGFTIGRERLDLGHKIKIATGTTIKNLDYSFRFIPVPEDATLLSQSNLSFSTITKLIVEKSDRILGLSD